MKDAKYMSFIYNVMILSNILILMKVYMGIKVIMQ